MKKYNLVNNILGWLSFAIAATTYLLTIEPTASFWDCGEFITSAYKLEVGHPPGAPFFMLTGKFFTLFASDPSQVAMMVNAMSAILSALTILFLFWTITHLAKKLIYTDSLKEMTIGQLITIMGCGLTGALVYTFSDTFWFSAVEGEVYAYSSMFTALVFWLILKWENAADKPHSDKWLILIAYTMGLSIGVHLLNLLCIPAIVLVYYFKKTGKANSKGILLALLASFALIVILMYGIIPGFTKVGGWFELFFVNSLGFSYNTGLFVYLFLLVGTIIWSIYETMSEKGNPTRAKISFILSIILAGVTFISSDPILWIALLLGAISFMVFYKKVNFRILNTCFLCLMVILIGYSSFALIPIRSMANPPMDQNSPEDVFSLTDYLNREQYGETPLFHGRTYASDVKRDHTNKPMENSIKDKYSKIVKTTEGEKDHYRVSGTSSSYSYTNSMLFPRMHSGEARHIEGYKMWGEINDEKIAPTMLENFRFFFSYQLNFMYWRYFMWNFSGRQNDVQNMGGINNGNWITGIGFIDEHILGLGSQDDLPPSIAENKGHNAYYMLPFILGLVGILYQITRKARGEKQFLITFMLFFMTGLAIVIYLNQKPFEPRERDYAYAGSFYAFSIWIGLGVAGLWALLKKALPETPAAVIASVVTLIVPVQMASQNWDDHDRSERYTMRDFGMNYLRSCEKDAIIFTNGDNDTFPLWYAQEVEGFRTDVRVCNLSYLQTDWYVDQMRRQSYDSKPLPITWTESQYTGDRGLYAYVLTKQQIQNAIKSRIQSEGGNWLDKMSAEQNINMGQFYDQNAFKDTLALDDVMEILKTQASYIPNNPFIEEGVIVPSNKLSLKIDQDKVDWKALNTQPTSEMVIDLGNKSVIYRNDIMVLEMINNINKEGWKRPIYFATTVGSDMYLNLQNQFSLDGMAYRILPGKVDATGTNTDVMFDNMINKFKWGNIENPKVYLDESNLRMCRTFRMMFARLITALIQEGKNEKALIALDTCLEKIPNATVPFEGESVVFADFYIRLGKPEKGVEILNLIENRAKKTITWYNKLKPAQMGNASREIAENFDTMLRIASVYNELGNNEKHKSLTNELQDYAQIYYLTGNGSIGNFALKGIAEDAIRSHHFSTDSVSKSQQEEIIQQTFGLMQKYSPALLNEFYKN